jgi:hypothetical protein
MREGGRTVSMAELSPIRFEASLDSKLPTPLRGAGHRVIDYGTHERLIPITETRKLNATNTTVATQHVGVGVANVWQFELPGQTFSGHRSSESVQDGICGDKSEGTGR